MSSDFEEMLETPLLDRDLTAGQQRLVRLLKYNLPKSMQLPEVASAGIKDPAIAKNVEYVAIPFGGFPSGNAKAIPAIGIGLQRRHLVNGRSLYIPGSGNTGLNFALNKESLGIKEVIAVVKEGTPQGKIDQLIFADAVVIEAPADKTPIAWARELAEQSGGYFADQYNDWASIWAHWEFTLPHFLNEFEKMGIRVSLLAFALGTTSLFVAASKYCKKFFPDMPILGIATGNGQDIPGARDLAGLEDTGFGYKDEMKEEGRYLVNDISQREAFAKTRELYLRSVWAGATSGLTIAGANKYIEQEYEAGGDRMKAIQNSHGKTVVGTVFVDGPLPYVSLAKKVLGLAR